jgi:hypothetical protein
MMRLVKSIEEDEKAHQAVLNEVKNEEEQLKIRKAFIEVKVKNQKAIKKTMAKHKKEFENLDKQELNAKLKEAKAKKEAEDHKSAGEEEQNGEEEQENFEGEEEMA